MGRKKDFYGLTLLIIRGISGMNFENEIWPFMKNELYINHENTFYKWTCGEQKPAKKVIIKEKVLNRALLINDFFVNYVKNRCDENIQKIIQDVIKFCLDYSKIKLEDIVDEIDDVERLISKILTITHKSKEKIDVPMEKLERFNVFYEENKGFKYLENNNIQSKFKVSLCNLPSLKNELIGREKELKDLYDAWKSEKIRIVSIIAPGGIGKTSLINKWINSMEMNNYDGAENVYGWSFYSQGKLESKQVSDKDFFENIQDFLEIYDVAEGNKERRIVKILSQKKSLIFLDGLEPLQNPPGDGGGKFKEAASSIGVFLNEFVRNVNGLCVITSRIGIADLKGKAFYKEIDLQSLSKQDGAKLLSQFGVVGKINELEKASNEYGGHALALTLLGNYIRDVFKGDIRQRDRILQLTKEAEHGNHAKRVIYAYELWLKNKPELDVLYIMGVFDRPAEYEAIRKIIEEDIIEGVTTNVKNLSNDEYKFVLRNLERIRLINISPDEKIDTHPLIREYFENRLKSDYYEAYKESNRRLYEYYKKVTVELPEEPYEMAPLYAAVVHGTRAELYPETLNDVYKRRIIRNGYFNLSKHGAYSDDLAAVANFYKEQWSEIIDSVSEEDKVFLLLRTGTALVGLGRYKESVEPIEKAMNKYIKKSNWEKSAICCANLAEIYTSLGKFELAIKYAKDGVNQIDNTKNTRLKYSIRAILAYCMFLFGDIDGSSKLFKVAESMQIEEDNKNKYLFSIRGARFCEFLIWNGEYDAVVERGLWALEIAESKKAILDIGLDSLSIGRALSFKGEFQMAEVFFNKAVEKLRNAGQKECIILGLLGRAEYWLSISHFNDALIDIEEAYRIAYDNELTLYIIDCYFLFIKLYIKEQDLLKAKEYYKLLKNKMEYIRYGLKYDTYKKIQCYLA